MSEKLPSHFTTAKTRFCNSENPRRESQTCSKPSMVFKIHGRGKSCSPETYPSRIFLAILTLPPYRVCLMFLRPRQNSPCFVAAVKRLPTPPTNIGFILYNQEKNTEILPRRKRGHILYPPVNFSAAVLPPAHRALGGRNQACAWRQHRTLLPPPET